MKSLETRIPQFYDVLDTENKQVRKIFDFVLNKAKKNGFLEIETSSVEIRDRYINATGVHFSKIFEVRRPKEGNTFVLQADLAMSMSRFVADFPSTIPHLKFIQLGKMYRDRIPNEEGYRREFKQILLGEWGTSSLFADAEVINLTYSCLKQVPNSKILYIEISNHNVFNSISEGLARKIRFEGIRNLEYINLHELDKKLIYKAFEKENLNISDIEIIYKKIINNSVKIELEKMISIYKFLKEQYGINDKIKYSIHPASVPFAITLVKAIIINPTTIQTATYLVLNMLISVINSTIPFPPLNLYIAGKQCPIIHPKITVDTNIVLAIFSPK